MHDVSILGCNSRQTQIKSRRIHRLANWPCIFPAVSNNQKLKTMRLGIFMYTEKVLLYNVHKSCCNNLKTSIIQHETYEKETCSLTSHSLAAKLPYLASTSQFKNATTAKEKVLEHSQRRRECGIARNNVSFTLGSLYNSLADTRRVLLVFLMCSGSKHPRSGAKEDRTQCRLTEASAPTSTISITLLKHSAIFLVRTNHTAHEPTVFPMPYHIFMNFVVRNMVGLSKIRPQGGKLMHHEFRMILSFSASNERLVVCILSKSSAKFVDCILKSVAHVFVI